MFQGVDDRLFFALAASSATSQRALGFAIFVARWAISFGPLALAALWTAETRLKPPIVLYRHVHCGVQRSRYAKSDAM